MQSDFPEVLSLCELPLNAVRVSGVQHLWPASTRYQMLPLTGWDPWLQVTGVQWRAEGEFGHQHNTYPTMPAAGQAAFSFDIGVAVSLCGGGVENYLAQKERQCIPKPLTFKTQSFQRNVSITTTQILGPTGPTFHLHPITSLAHQCRGISRKKGRMSATLWPPSDPLLASGGSRQLSIESQDWKGP